MNAPVAAARAGRSARKPSQDEIAGDPRSRGEESVPPSVAMLVDDLVEWLEAGFQPSGIQRVVSELLRTAAHRDDVDVWPAGIEATWRQARLRRVDPVRLSWDREKTAASGRRDGALRATMKRAIPWAVRHRLRSVQRSAKGGIQGFRTIGPSVPADRLIAPGAFWAAGHARPLRRLAMTERVPLRVLVYDLIPIRYPEWFGTTLTKPFTRSLDLVLPFAERVVTLSQQAADDLAHHRPALAARIRVAVPTLAAHVPTVAPAEARRDGRFLLALGTVEPRKNYRLILDAWRIARRDPRLAETRLVIAGRRGGPNEDIEAEIARTPGVDRVANASDRDVEALYRDCLATVHASVVEGFGLPVRESVVRGIPTLTSSAIPRDGLPPGTYELFEPDDAEGLARLIVGTAAEERARNPPARPGGTGWEPVLEALVD